MVRTRLCEVVINSERVQPLWYTRSLPEVDGMLAACTVRNSADGRGYILRTPNGDMQVAFAPESSSLSTLEDPKAQLVGGFGFGFGSLSPATEVFVHALQTLVNAIDAAAFDAAARVRAPLPVSAAAAVEMYTAAQACATMKREYPLLNATMEDAATLIQMRQATLRAVGATLLTIAAESEGGTPSARVMESLASARALQARCRHATRDLEQLAWASAPLWLTRRPPDLCQHTCDGVAALSLWGAAVFGDGTDSADDSTRQYLLAVAYFANPHLLHYVAKLRDAPAQCGVPPTQPGTDRRASAWYAAVRIAADARTEEGRELREPWTRDDAIQAARALLTAPFDAAKPFHATALVHAERARASAAAAYAREAYLEAAEAYGYALAVAPWADAQARAAMLSSRAQCALSASLPAAAEADCTASLALRPGDAKTLLRRARARHEAGAPGAEDDLAAARGC
jgi:hypothetical protein